MTVNTEAEKVSFAGESTRLTEWEPPAEIESRVREA